MEDKSLAIPASPPAQLLTLKAYIRTQLEATWRCNPLLLCCEDRFSLKGGDELDALFRQEIAQHLGSTQRLAWLDSPPDRVAPKPGGDEPKSPASAPSFTPLSPQKDPRIEVRPRAEHSHLPSISLPESWCGASMWIVTAGDNEDRIEGLQRALSSLSRWLAPEHSSPEREPEGQADGSIDQNLGRFAAYIQNASAQVEWIDIQFYPDHRAQWRQQDLRDTQNWQRLEHALRARGALPIPAASKARRTDADFVAPAPAAAQPSSASPKAKIPPAPQRPSTSAPAPAPDPKAPEPARDLKSPPPQPLACPQASIRLLKRRPRLNRTLPKRPIDLRSTRSIPKASLAATR